MNISLVSNTTSRRAIVATGLASTLSAIPMVALARQATPDLGSTEEELLIETEHRRLQSLLDFDSDNAYSLHAEDFQLINPLGGTLSRADYLGGLEAGVFDYVMMERVSPIDVRVYADVAALRYQSKIEIHLDGIQFHIDGETVDIGTFWHTNLYEKRAGIWVAVWSQATRVV